MRYWKPWHPPLSMDTRSAREGLLSELEMVESRWAARGESDKRMGSPESVVRGWSMAWAGSG